MKSRQLANVLIKIVGFYICICAIPSCVGGICLAIETKGFTTSDLIMRTFSFAIGYGIQAVVGIIIIAMSRKISGWMFKSEDE
jgi:hypothetical protein